MEFKRGRFFVMEGADGSGKATQTKLLLKKLLKEGYETKILDFPRYGEDIFGETVGALLSNEFGNTTEVNPYLASFLYAADRWKVSPEIRSELKRGTILISNRFTSASMGHQGSKIDDPKKRYEFLEWLRRLEFSKEGFGIPKPDATIYLYVDPKVSQELIKQKEARMYTGGQTMDGAERDFSHQEKTALNFLEIAKSEPSWRIIKCMDENGNLLKPEIIEEKIWEIIKPFLPPKQQPS